jgi:hypothetical protein
MGWGLLVLVTGYALLGPAKAWLDRPTAVMGFGLIGLGLCLNQRRHQPG